MSKRIFDIFFSFIGFIMVSPVLMIALIIAAMDTKSNGLFSQTRIGQFGLPFTIYKLRTMHSVKNSVSNYGRFLRKSKIDEIPQLLNIIKGDMSFVGPRPDIAGYYDTLQGEQRKILELKPGLTSEAALKYTNEDQLLAKQQHPLEYNDTVIFPDKVRMNLEYYYKRSFWGDFKIIWKTIVSLF